MLLLLQKWQQSSFEQLQLFEGTRALQTGQSTWECQPINNIEVTISVLTVSINWQKVLLNYFQLFLVSAPLSKLFFFFFWSLVLIKGQTRIPWSAFSSDAPTNFSSLVVLRALTTYKHILGFPSLSAVLCYLPRQHFICSRFLPHVTLCTKVCHLWTYFHCNYYAAVVSSFSRGRTFFLCNSPTQQHCLCVTKSKISIWRLADQHNCKQEARKCCQKRKRHTRTEPSVCGQYAAIGICSTMRSSLNLPFSTQSNLVLTKSHRTQPSLYSIFIVSTCSSSAKIVEKNLTRSAISVFVILRFDCTVKSKSWKKKNCIYRASQQQ